MQELNPEIFLAGLEKKAFAKIKASCPGDTVILDLSGGCVGASGAVSKLDNVPFRLMGIVYFTVFFCHR
jgi:hypothetical protein